jgi:hypothetical protein
MGRRKVKWQSGDNFVVPLGDGTYGQGQVLCYELHALDSALCAFSSHRFGEVPVHLDSIAERNLIAHSFVTRDFLDSGHWRIVDNGPILIPWEELVDIRRLRKKGFIEVTIHGSGIAVDFLKAYHQLIPWNSYFDPEYFDKMLISRDRKPAHVLLK